MYDGTEEGVHLGLPESGEVERGVVLGVASVVDADEPGDEGLVRGVRDDVRGVRRPLSHFVDEVDREVVVQREPGIV